MTFRTTDFRFSINIPTMKCRGIKCLGITVAGQIVAVPKIHS